MKSIDFHSACMAT